MRFRAECPDGTTCNKHYGPFAPYIHADARSWDDSVFAELPGAEFAPLGKPSVYAFTDGNLVVMNRQAGVAYAATVMHEAEHRLIRAGQQLRAADGRWLQVKRDVPTASALTYLQVLKAADTQSPYPILVSKDCSRSGFATHNTIHKQRSLTCETPCATLTTWGRRKQNRPTLQAHCCWA